MLPGTGMEGNAGMLSLISGRTVKPTSQSSPRWKLARVGLAQYDEQTVLACVFCTVTPWRAMTSRATQTCSAHKLRDPTLKRRAMKTLSTRDARKQAETAARPSADERAVVEEEVKGLRDDFAEAEREAKAQRQAQVIEETTPTEDALDQLSDESAQGGKVLLDVPAEASALVLDGEAADGRVDYEFVMANGAQGRISRRKSLRQPKPVDKLDI